MRRFKRGKRKRNRVIFIMALTILVALAMTGMRSCADRYDEPYNTGYVPMDETRQQAQEE
ncbi:MAG: hypothetical protein R8M38_02040 [Mariprofundaceae bacterium]